MRTSFDDAPSGYDWLDSHTLLLYIRVGIFQSQSNLPSRILFISSLAWTDNSYVRGIPHSTSLACLILFAGCVLRFSFAPIIDYFGVTGASSFYLHYCKRQAWGFLQ